MRLSFLILLLLCSPFLSARAQVVVINRPPVGSAPAQHQRVTVSVTLATPAPPGVAASGLTKDMAAADQSLYAVINRQCDLLGTVLNGDCRMVQLSTNGTVGERTTFGAPASPTATVNVTANAVFEIDPKQTQIPAVRP